MHIQVENCRAIFLDKAFSGSYSVLPRNPSIAFVSFSERSFSSQNAYSLAHFESKSWFFIDLGEYNRFLTTSSVVSFASFGAILIDRWYYCYMIPRYPAKCCRGVYRGGSGRSLRPMWLRGDKIPPHPTCNHV